MNQIRTFLIIAWLMVATLLWMQWGRDGAANDAATDATATAQPAAPSAGGADGSVPAIPATPAVPGATGAVPAAPAAAPPVAAASATPATGVVDVRTDVLHLQMSGGAVGFAELVRYPQTRAEGSPRVRLFDTDPARFYAAQSGWVAQGQPAPSHESGFQPEGGRDAFVLGEGESTLVVPFTWTGGGVTIRRTWTFTRGSYAVAVQDTVTNAGAAPWTGYAYRQLSRVPPVTKSGMTNPDAFSLNGVAWYAPGADYTRFPFKDFIEEMPATEQHTGGWIAILQHHFFTAWIPEETAVNTVSLADDRSTGLPRYLVREVGAGTTVAPGAQATTAARLWVGPKLVGDMRAQDVRGLDRAVDYSRFAMFAMVGEALFWILDHLHGLFGNWGWSIIGLVLLVKLAMYPLSKAQYRSMAKMRKFQPRMQQLKERYGDDKQKLQVAMMELYKKEKINPVGGCLPVLLQMPIFLALYWVLLESVELRHAPWIGWIQDLTARDPYFILPIINIAVMWTTQRLTPMVGMDPMQQKIMMFMPLVFGVMMVFFPSGLVLYWVTNGALGLLQQWWLIRVYADKPAVDAKP